MTELSDLREDLQYVEENWDEINDPEGRVAAAVREFFDDPVAVVRRGVESGEIEVQEIVDYEAAVKRVSQLRSDEARLAHLKGHYETDQVWAKAIINAALGRTG